MSHSSEKSTSSQSPASHKHAELVPSETVLNTHKAGPTPATSPSPVQAVPAPVNHIVASTAAPAIVQTGPQGSFTEAAAPAPIAAAASQKRELTMEEKKLESKKYVEEEDKKKKVPEKKADERKAAAPSPPLSPKGVKVPAMFAYGSEAASAIVSAFLVAPFISIIDKAIFSNASGKERMVESLINSTKTAVSKPRYFFKSPAFLWIWLVYGGTYTTANMVERACDRNGVDWFVPKFIGSSIANVSLSLAKDRSYSRMYKLLLRLTTSSRFVFGTTAPRPVPVASLALYAARDSMTIGASFNLPSVMSKNLQQRGYGEKTADILAQLITPIAMQLFNTPLHLLGMDIYNNPQRTQSERLSFIKQEYLKTLFARWGRIFPAFGIGGLTNKAIRKSVNTSLADRYH